MCTTLQTASEDTYRNLEIAQCCIQPIVSQKQDMSVGKRPPSVGDSREAR